MVSFAWVLRSYQFHPSSTNLFSVFLVPECTQPQRFTVCANKHDRRHSGSVVSTELTPPGLTGTFVCWVCMFSPWWFPPTHQRHASYCHWPTHWPPVSGCWSVAAHCSVVVWWVKCRRQTSLKGLIKYNLTQLNCLIKAIWRLMCSGKRFSFRNITHRLSLVTV